MSTLLFFFASIHGSTPTTFFQPYICFYLSSSFYKLSPDLISIVFGSLPRTSPATQTPELAELSRSSCFGIFSSSFFRCFCHKTNTVQAAKRTLNGRLTLAFRQAGDPRTTVGLSTMTHNGFISFIWTPYKRIQGYSVLRTFGPFPTGEFKPEALSF